MICPGNYLELLTTAGPRWELQGLLHTLQARLHLQLKDEPTRFFDHAIATSSVYGTTQHYFGKWIKEDPEAAVAWFRSKDPGKDFDTGKFESRQSRSRDNLRWVLLETLAETDLETALALVREENARGKSYLIPNSLQSKLIEQAATSGDDSALLDLLRSNPDSHLPSSRWANDPESFWVRFTGATDDLDRSVRLLQTLEKPNGYGEAMAAIISTQADLPLPQQVDWLHEQIPDRESRDQSVSHLLLGQDSFDPFSDNYKGVSPQTREWLDQQARRQENDPFLSSTATALSNTGKHLAAYEIASRLTRSEANESLAREFARRLYQSDEAAAARVLPPELLEQISTPQE